MDADPVARLTLSIVFVALLMVTRWWHERQQVFARLRTPLARRARLSPDYDALGVERPVRRVAYVEASRALYWLGLTGSAALAAQAIAAIAVGAGG